MALAECSAAQPDQGATATAASGAVTTQEAKGELTPSNPGTGIIKSTTMTSCDTKEGEVTAAGTVTLPENVKGTIKVSVSWVDPKTSSLLAQETKTIEDARTGKAIDWTVKTHARETHYRGQMRPGFNRPPCRLTKHRIGIRTG